MLDTPLYPPSDTLFYPPLYPPLYPPPGHTHRQVMDVRDQYRADTSYVVETLLNAGSQVALCSPGVCEYWTPSSFS